MRVNFVSGRIREREFTSPAASLLPSNDHRADCCGVGFVANQLEFVSPVGDQGSGVMRHLPVAYAGSVYANLVAVFLCEVLYEKVVLA